MRNWLPLLVLAAGCPRKIPDHLRLDPPEDQAATSPEIEDVRSALAAMLGRDPLARSPELPSVEVLARIEGGDALLAYAESVRALERGEGQVERALQQLEDEWRSSSAVALARGYRLRIAENQLAQAGGVSQEQEALIVTLVTPLSGGASDETLPRTALAWLVDGQRLESTVRSYADRWVLQGWMAHPSIPVDVLAPLLSAPQYDDLRETSMGRLVLARAGGATADIEPGFADLEHATRLALQQAAADRDKEQAAWAEVRRAEIEALSSEDPIGTLLKRAAATLTAGAGDDRAAGAALLALAADRWHGDCPQAPCKGVDRLETIHLASAWHPDLVWVASVWRVIALKEVLDSLEVGRETAMFPGVMVDLVDALLGTGGGPLDAQLLRQRRPDASLWLAVARAVGTEGVVDWEGTREALGQHLAAEAGRAIEVAPDQDVAAMLERIRSRAIP